MTAPLGGSDGATAPDSTASPTLTAVQIARLEPHGRVEHLAAGSFLFTEGQDSYDFAVIIEGGISIIRRDEAVGHEVVIARHGTGRFLGELNLLTGERTYLAARTDVDSTVLLVTPQELRVVMAGETDLADLIFAAFVARRELLRTGEGAQTLRILGSQYSARALEIRRFVRRQRLPHTWIDLDAPDVEDIEVLLESVCVTRTDTPVVVTATAVLRNPTVGELAEHLGVSFRVVQGRVYDVAVVGAGPAGLAAGVYGASEGLDTLILEAVDMGGQAGTSSRIENFFGFPSGIAGGELVERGALQATRLGADIRLPCEVARLAHAHAGYALVLQAGAEVVARAVVVASGVQYRKLPLERLEHFEGAGVYYAATDLEARACDGEPVVVVGGGNSAGQAAVFLAQRGSDVIIAIRGAGLAASMSKYLTDRIAAALNITVRRHTQVVALHGDGRLQRVTLRTSDPGSDRATDTTVACAGVFSFIGAVPFTGWLAPHLALDERGFVLTDRDLPADVRGGVTPLPFETSQPGIFAVGDVRRGSMKRVAAAVGEGASAIRSVHDHLARVNAS